MDTVLNKETQSKWKNYCKENPEANCTFPLGPSSNDLTININIDSFIILDTL